MLVGPCVVGDSQPLSEVYDSCRVVARPRLYYCRRCGAASSVMVQLLCIEAGSSSGQLADALLGWHPLLQLAMFVVATVSTTANAPSLKQLKLSIHQLGVLSA
jgi:hypothetical protein